MDSKTKLLIGMTAWGMMVMIALQFEYEGFVFIKAMTIALIVITTLRVIKELFRSKR